MDGMIEVYGDVHSSIYNYVRTKAVVNLKSIKMVTKKHDDRACIEFQDGTFIVCEDSYDSVKERMGLIGGD